MDVHLIRHAKTQGNLERRYIGKTDESLAKLAIKNLKTYRTNIDQVFSSPLKRSLETAEILFPHKKILIKENLKECYFGDFENKNYDELKNDLNYQKWIAGKIDTPNGEKKEAFTKRCCNEFKKIIDESFREKLNSIAIITHGGVIMTIMENFALPKKDFYDWQPQNATGLLVKANNLSWEKTQNVFFIKEIKSL